MKDESSNTRCLVDTVLLVTEAVKLYIRKAERLSLTQIFVMSVAYYPSHIWLCLYSMCIKCLYMNGLIKAVTYVVQ